jgi:uncharacterized protein DUF6518
VRIALAAGLVLGVLSRVEETVEGLDAGISTNLTWLAVAFASGAAARRRSAVAGAFALTAANAGYYAYVAITEPGRPLAGVAGPVERWFALGIAGGIVFGAAGALIRDERARVRAAGALPIAALLLAEQIPALQAVLP